MKLTASLNHAVKTAPMAWCAAVCEKASLSSSIHAPTQPRFGYQPVEGNLDATHSEGWVV
jgi:hypothetical protein